MVLVASGNGDRFCHHAFIDVGMVHDRLHLRLAAPSFIRYWSPVNLAAVAGGLFDLYRRGECGYDASN